jgi:hypothetical protein
LMIDSWCIAFATVLIWEDNSACLLRALVKAVSTEPIVLVHLKIIVQSCRSILSF